ADRRLAYLQVSAEANQIYPEVLGLGSNAGWAQLGAKINALRSYVATKADEDVVIAADAYDVLVMGGKAEILRVFEDLERESGKSLVFNAEPACFPPTDGICEKHPPAKWRWRFLNAGLIVGRAHAYKNMLRELVPLEVNDQWWFHMYRRDHPDEILLDTGCNLSCTLYTVGGGGISLLDRRIHVQVTQTSPPLVHFVSFGHRTKWIKGRPTSYLQETFRQLYPEQSARLLEGWWLGINVAATHDLTIYDGEGFWLMMTSVLCLQCTFTGAVSDDCLELHNGSTCHWLNVSWLLLLLSLAVLVWLRWGNLGLRLQSCWPCLRLRYANLAGSQKPPGLDC
ncbi:unnamed protein product, partial [Symbiodinium natans]